MPTLILSNLNTDEHIYVTRLYGLPSPCWEADGVVRIPVETDEYAALIVKTFLERFPSNVASIKLERPGARNVFDR